MKHASDHLRRATAATDEPCSETKCVTCFENRGCMYQQYVAALMNKIEEAYLANHVNKTIQQIGRRA